MSKKVIWFAALLLPLVLMAGGEHEGSRYLAQTGRENDLIPRIFNFIIFAALAYYLVASPIKNFFKGRTEGIASQLNEIESKLQEAKEAKKRAEQELVESEEKAKEIVADAENESKLIAERVEANIANDLESLEKIHNEKIEHESRKATKEVISTLLGENITSDDIPVSQQQVADIIAKKVA